ncbi:hypothetical protein N0V85_007284 [Neurospora sp. IMI 360204]|nr:hypothetical protein N0V85_007284 [Neurospora sp. IMI 360204]
MPLSTCQNVLTTSISLLFKTSASLLLFIIVAILAISLYRLFLHPLAGIPGPRLAALSNIWHAYHARNGRMYHLGKTLHKRYGPVVRVGPNELWFDSREAFRRIYNTLDLLSERVLSRYRLQRRLIGPLYQLSSLKKFEPQIDSVLSSAITQLRSLKGEEVDLKEWMHIIAVECLGAVVLGWSPGYIRDKSEGGTSGQGYRGWKRKSVFGLFPLVTKVGFLEGKFRLGEKVGKGVGRWFSNLWGVTFSTPKGFKPFFTPVYQKSSKRIAAALKGEVQDPRAKPSKSKKNKPAKVKEVARPHDLLEDLINLHKSKPDLFKETYLRRMATTNFGAGHETLCSALTACMAMIGLHAGVQERVAEEVGTYLRGQGQAGGSGTVPFDTTAKQLPYTLAAIKEAQRLHPVIAMSLSRTVPRGTLHGKGGVVLHGHWVPEGTTVGCNPVALHRNREIFGEDADVYEPGRWLSSSFKSSSNNSNANSTPGSSNANSESNAESESESGFTSATDLEESEKKRLREMLHLNLTYGGGARTCPGRHLAELILWKVVPRLLAEFRVEVTHMPGEEDMERYFMSMLTGVKVTFLEREGGGS